jgi:ethanolamine ammonia-lyase small subunit
MADDQDDLALSSDRVNDWPEIVRRVRAQTPARILSGRAGAAYRTKTQLELRAAHAAARDAVRAELHLERDFGAEFTKRWNLFEVFTQARSKDEYLQRPELGRCFSEEARAELLRRVSREQNLIVAIGDGLSVPAVSRQVPPLLDLLYDQAKARGWKVGQPFVIRHCRVGILNEIGSLLSPEVAVLLIGERPGLATAESLSAYLAYRPQPGDTDAKRNLISNIHSRGVQTKDAALRIVSLAARMMQEATSGYRLREELPAPGSARSQLINEAAQELP